MARIMRAIALVGLTVAATGCWPTTGGNADRQAYNPLETGITAATAPTLAPAWTVTTEAGARGVSSPVVSPAALVHVTTESSVYAIELRDGAVRWVETPYASAGGASVDTEMTVFGDRQDLYVSFRRGAQWENGIFAAADGWWISEFFGRQEGIRTGARPQDLRAAFSTFSTTPSGQRQGLSTFGGVVGAALTDHPGPARLTVGTQLVFHAGSGLLATVPGDGTEGNGLRAFPYAGGTATCGAPGDAVFACPAWVAPLDGTTATTPVLSQGGDTAYVATDAGTVAGVDTATGAVRWTATVGSPVVAPPALTPGALLVPTTSGALVALDPAGCGAATCPPLWTTAAGSSLRVQPGAAGDVVVTGADDGTLAAYATEGCGAAVCPPVWTAAVGSAITGAPVLAGGHLVAGTADGRVVAYVPTT